MPADAAGTSTAVTSRVRAALAAGYSDHVDLVKGAAGVMVSAVVTSAAGWLFWLIATHRFSTSQVGVASSLVAALSVIALIAGQPVATTLLLRIPRSTQRTGLFETGTIVSGATAVVLGVVAVVVLPHSLHAVRTGGLASLFVIGSCAGAVGIVIDASALAVRRPRLMVARNGAHGVGKLLVLAAIALPAGLVSGPVAIIGSWVTVSVLVSVVAAWSWWRTERADAARVAVPRAESRRAGWDELRVGLPAQVVGTLAGSLPPQVLPIIVIATLGATEAGWFSITWLVGGICFMISPSVCQALLAEGSLRPDQLAAKTRAAVLLSAGLLVAPFIVFVAAGSVVLGFFGPSYAANGTTLLVILAISAIPDLVTNVGVAWLRVQHRLWEAAVVNGSIAIVALCGSVWALDRYGVDGAGWAWLAAESLGCVVLAGCVAGPFAQRPAAVRTGTVAT